MFEALQNFDNFIFDLDGTILDSAPAVLRCLKMALDTSGVAYKSEALTTAVIGPVLPEIVKMLAPTASQPELEKLVTLFRQFYAQDPLTGCQIFPDMRELLEHLRQNNKKIFMATYKPTFFTNLILDKLELSQYFKEILTPDSNLTKVEMIKYLVHKYCLDSHKTVMLGDAVTDMQAAKEANVYALAVPWGYEKDKNKLVQISDGVFKL